MPTQSPSEGCKTPITVTLRYSSSARLDFRLTLILGEGLMTLKGHSGSFLRFNSRKSEIAVWFLCMAMESICEGCNGHDKEGEELRKNVTNMMNSTLKTQQELLGSMRELRDKVMILNLEYCSNLV